jgi:predicted RNA binding protein YcfA (HicA-like mRNA interferase family)
VTRSLPEVSGARLKRALERAGFVAVHTRGSICQSPTERAMRMRMTSLVPSPISSTLASR